MIEGPTYSFPLTPAWTRVAGSTRAGGEAPERLIPAAEPIQSEPAPNESIRDRSEAADKTAAPSPIGSEPTEEASARTPAESKGDGRDETGRSPRPGGVSVKDLTPREEAQVQKLRRRDIAVKRHEQAHVAAAGGLARGGVRYTYRTGPDGRRYAVGGHVAIDSSPVPGDPEATIRKAQVVRRAALAPPDPSAKDRQVAAKASRMEAEARLELAEEKKQERLEAEEAAEKRAEGPAGTAEAETEPGRSAGQAESSPQAADGESRSPGDFRGLSGVRAYQYYSLSPQAELSRNRPPAQAGLDFYL